MDPVVHFEIPANNMKRAKKFYEGVFGWEIISSYDTYYIAHTTPTNVGSMSKDPGVINGGIQTKDETIGSTRLVVNVTNIDEALERVLEEGGRIFIPKKQIPGMLYSVIYDTEGNEINIVESIK